MAVAGMKVGELARRTGVSVRTLHHYDELGLLVPSRRTASGHRLYGVREVRRLQQIRSLQQIGLTLDEVRACLDRREYSLRRVIEMQLERVRKQIEAQTALCERLEGLARLLDAQGHVPVEPFLQTMEAMAMMEQYYTPEQLEQLKRRGEEVGEARIREVEQEWPRLIASVKSAMERGVEPTSEEVLALARRWRDLVREFTGGDAGITKSLGNYNRATVQQQGSVHGMEATVFGYVGRAIAALEAAGERGLVDAP